MTTSADGAPMYTMALVSATPIRGMIFPTNTSGGVFEGRGNSRTGCNIYFAGQQDIRIDDEIYATFGGSTDVWRVIGAVNPAEISRSQVGDYHLNFTVVDVIMVKPKTTVGLEEI